MLIETLVAALSVPLLTLGAAVIEQRQVQGRWCYDCVTPETVDCWYASVVHGKNITCEPPHPPICDKEPEPPLCECEPPRWCYERYKYPESCFCWNQEVLNCWYKCGGPEPQLQWCGREG